MDFLALVITVFDLDLSHVETAASRALLLPTASPTPMLMTTSSILGISITFYIGICLEVLLQLQPNIFLCNLVFAIQLFPPFPENYLSITSPHFLQTLTVTPATSVF